jgi:hypothetical protein
MSAEFFDGTRRLTLIGITQHQLLVRLVLRKNEPLSKLNVACVDKSGWGYQRTPADVVKIRQVFDQNDRGHATYTNDDGSTTVHHHPPVVKGKRPSGLAIVVVPTRPWSGWLSIRDETTSQTARLHLQIMDKPAGQP